VKAVQLQGKGKITLYEEVIKTLQEVLDDWDMMQTTTGDEGAEWAEVFERHFYIFIDALKKWMDHLEHPPENIDEAEKMPEIKSIEEKLPAPLQLNFMTELEMIVEGEDLSEFD
jgi:hypothetical protein